MQDKRKSNPAMTNYTLFHNYWTTSFRLLRTISYHGFVPLLDLSLHFITYIS